MSLAEAQAVASQKAMKDAKDEKDAAAVVARLSVKSDPSRPSPSSQIKASGKSGQQQNSNWPLEKSISMSNAKLIFWTTHYLKNAYLIDTL